MHPYLPHLLADIEALIKEPPPGAYYEVPPHLEENPEIAEIALSPFTTLEELTGIPIESIPPFFEFMVEDLVLLADSFRRLLEALNIAIVDLPDDFPDDAFVNLIHIHWNEDIQYMPLAGYDMECCSGNNETCPYGEDCLGCGPNAPSLDEEERPEIFVGGLFNDDGTRIDPLKVPIPGLCLRCTRYLSKDREDDMLCTLTRNDQKENEVFHCGSFDRQIT